MCKHSSEETAFRKALQAQEEQNMFINLVFCMVFSSQNGLLQC